jgi:hypothetical protein
MPLSIRVNVTVPKIMFKDKKWVDNVADIMKDKAAPRLKELFRGTTYGWSEHPSFRQTLTRRAASLSMEVYTTDANYGLINAGSPPHPIPARQGGILRFRPGYRSATKAGSLISNRAYRSGPYVTAMSVAHPGFEPRRFDELVAKEYEPDFRRDVQEAINNAAINR